MFLELPIIIIGALIASLIAAWLYDLYCSQKGRQKISVVLCMEVSSLNCGVNDVLCKIKNFKHDDKSKLIELTRQIPHIMLTSAFTTGKILILRRDELILLWMLHQFIQQFNEEVFVLQQQIINTPTESSNPITRDVLASLQKRYESLNGHILDVMALDWYIKHIPKRH